MRLKDWEYYLIILQAYFISVHLQHTTLCPRTNITETNMSDVIFVASSAVYADVFRDWKRLKRAIEKLKTHSDTRYNEFEDLINIEKDVLKLKAEFGQNTDSLEPKNEFMLSKIHSEIIRIDKKVEFLAKVFEARRKERMYIECIKLIKSKRFDKALTNLYLINDIDKTNLIIDAVFNNNLTNYDLVDNFAREVPSIKLTFAIYKRLKTNMDSNFIIDNETGLKLIESLFKNVADQVSVDPITKLETLELIEELETKIKETLTGVMKEYINGGDIEFNKLIDRITYGTSNKFFNEISEKVISVIDTKTLTNKIEKIKSLKPIMRMITLQKLYSKISEKGVTSETVNYLMTIKKTAKDALELNNERKESLKEIYNSIPDPKMSVVMILKHSILNNYSSENRILKLSSKTYKYNKKDFINIMRYLVEEVYDKKETAEIIEWMKKLKNIGETIAAYKAIFEKMKDSLNNINANTVAGIITLEDYVVKVFDLKNFKNVDFEFVSYLREMKAALSGSMDKVKNIIKESILEGTYKTDGFQRFIVQVFSARLYGKVIPDVIKELVREKTFDEETKAVSNVLQFTDAHDDNRLKIAELINLIGNIIKNKVAVFDIVERFKKIYLSKDYDTIEIMGKWKLEINKNKLPSSVKSVVFCKKSLIKSMPHGEYLYLDQYHNKSAAFTLKSGSRNGSFWIFEYTGEKGIYTIKNEKTNEYLSAGENKYNLDNNHRMVISSRKADGPENWQLVPITGGGVLIKSAFYNEFLFTTSRYKDRLKRNVLTYRVGSEKGKWKIECLLEDITHL